MAPFALDASVLLHHAVLCSGITSGDGELCLVSGAAGVSLEPCLLAIAAGDGREVMELDKDRAPACLGASRAASVGVGIHRMPRSRNHSCLMRHVV